MMDTTNKLTEWVNQYTDSLYNWAFMKVDHAQTAEDLVQETFLAAHKAIDKFQNKSQPKTWLLSILKNKIADHYRKQYKMQLVNESEISKEGSSDVLDKFFDAGGGWKKDMRPGEWESNETHLLDNYDFLEVLKGCMQGLNKNSFLALQYKFLDEKDSKLICQELEITPSNFWQILHRAKIQVRGCIDKNWFNN